MNTLAQIATFYQFQPQMLVAVLMIILLLFLSAMISGSETAFFSLSPSNVNSIKERKSRSDSAILKLLGTQDYLLATILIANNLINISIVLLSNNLIDELVTFSTPGWEFVIKTVIVTFVLLLFGEITPKIYSAYHPLKFARFISVPLLAAKHLMYPFSWMLIKSSNFVNERLARKRSAISIGELSSAIEITKDHSEEERQMLSGIVTFGDTEVVEIMKLRLDIVALDVTSDFDKVKECILESGFSRIPVYEDNLDNIKGILYVKDMTPFINQPNDFGWQARLRTAYFVPEHKKINDLLEEFQTNKVHIAIVVDEYGATQGLVSLEDIVEEIVGEISDESDVEEETAYRKLDARNYIFQGKIHIADFEKILELKDDALANLSVNSETLAGLMLELKHDFLKIGESVESNGIRFTVESLDGRRIEKVRVYIKELPEPISHN